MKKIWILLGCVILSTVFSSCGPQKQTKPQAKAVIEFVNSDHQMEHVTFAGGYLRNEPEITGGNIIAPLLKGSRGIIYGKRRINNQEWAKVTTREGETGWYSPSDGLTSGAEDYLRTEEHNYQRSYPRISGLKENVNKAINAEIDNYLQVFKLVVGPVGSSLQSRVTYNKNNVLSVLFTLPKVNYRTYDLNLTQDAAKWEKVKKYCSLSPLENLAASSGLTAEVSDLQYAMTFDLTTGKRLSLDYFMDKEKLAAYEKERKQRGLKDLAKDNFYVEGTNLLVTLVETGEPPWGRERLDLSTLVKNEFKCKDGV